jgi:mannan endo-1,4-beta-mannosidase
MVKRRGASLHVLAVVLLVILGLPGVARAAGGGPMLREAVLNYLYGYANGRTISGMHHKAEVGGVPAADWATHWSTHISQVTGEWPGVWGADFAWYPQYREELMTAAEQEYHAGSLVTLMWHSCRPKTVVESCHQSATSGTPDEMLTSAEWADLLTDGTPLNAAWHRDLDLVAGYLAQLRDAGVGVLWRPLHEMNDGWSWWGGHGAQTRQLYEMMHDYFDARGLTNLVWVWNVTDKNPDEFATYLPADQYVDVLSLDVWNKGTAAGNDEPSAAEYDTVVRLANGRPVALGEVKKVPSPALLARQPRWSWFMLWPDSLESTDPGQLALNSPAVLQATYSAPTVISQAQLNRPPAAAISDPIWPPGSRSGRRPARTPGWMPAGRSTATAGPDGAAPTPTVSGSISNWPRRPSSATSGSTGRQRSPRNSRCSSPRTE